MNANVYYK